MTLEEKITRLENMVLLQSDRLQLLYLQTRALKLELNDTEYLDYLTCYLKKVIAP